MYTFGVLDPRPGADNGALLGPNTLGIEVTIPSLATLCGLGNIDPQHTDGDADHAAIEVAMKIQPPPDGAVLVTVRADLDSIGAMAVMTMALDLVHCGCEYCGPPYKQLGVYRNGAVCCGVCGTFWGAVGGLPKFNERVALVAAADKFARGGWPGRHPMPTRDDPWPNPATESAETSRPLAAIAAAVSDFKLPIEERVRMMRLWLEGGEEPAAYRERVEKERMELVAAIERGEIKIETVSDGRITVVTSTHRAATAIGYSQCPIVVAVNPVFRFQGGDPHRKVTVCQFEAGHVDLGAALAELNALEPGWGGSPTIGGSPQGVASTLTVEQIVAVLEKHLK